MGVYTGFILGLSWVYIVYTLSGSLYFIRVYTVYTLSGSLYGVYTWVYIVYTLSGSLYWVYPGFILGLYCLYFEWEFILYTGCILFIL